MIVTVIKTIIATAFKATNKYTPKNTLNKVFIVFPFKFYLSKTISNTLSGLKSYKSFKEFQVSLNILHCLFFN